MSLEYDDAGYQPTPLTVTFYIGKPDLIASALIVPDHLLYWH